jgi:hypothetical protein
MAEHRTTTLSEPVAAEMAAALIAAVCDLCAGSEYLVQTRRAFQNNGVADAIRDRRVGPIYEWLVQLFGYQGVTDHVARQTWATSGGVSHGAVARSLAAASCPKLRAYWTFEGCGHRKGRWECGEPDHRIECPLPRLAMRNGRLNQSAYGLALFLRDLTDDDLVGWIDYRLAIAPRPWTTAVLEAAVVQPLCGVFGVSNKVVSMAMADLLLGGDPSRAAWVEAGGQLIVIDTLVHNWLHRTGILASDEAEHSYGSGCYGPGGCSDIVRRAASRIDARRWCADYPQTFPRLVQHALWRFCAASELNVCNAVRIDDRAPCGNTGCIVHDCCARLPLRR